MVAQACPSGLPPSLGRLHVGIRAGWLPRGLVQEAARRLLTLAARTAGEFSMVSRGVVLFRQSKSRREPGTELKQLPVFLGGRHWFFQSKRGIEEYY